MIVRQNLTLRSVYVNAPVVSQSIYWEGMILMIFVFCVWINIYRLYENIKSDVFNDKSILSSQRWYFVNLICFNIIFIIFIISSLCATSMNSIVVNWIEFISCILSVVFCLLSHLAYFVYRSKFNDVVKNDKWLNQDESDVLMNSDDKYEDNLLKITETVMFILFQFIMVQIISNLLYFNLPLNLCVNIFLIVFLQICLAYFGIVTDFIGSISILITVILYLIQLSKQIGINASVQLQSDDVQSLTMENSNLILQNTEALNTISTINNSLSSLESVNADLAAQNTEAQNTIDTINNSLLSVQNSLSAALITNDSLQGNLNSANTSNTQLTTYRNDSLTDQLNANIKMLQQHVDYFNLVEQLFNQLQQEFISESPDVSGQNYYLGYSSRIGVLITQVNNLLSQAQGLLSNVVNILSTDISGFNSNLSALVNNGDFIRSHIFFLVPTSMQNTDSATFNLLYEFGIKVFAHFFRNKFNNIIPWNNNNEIVVRDVIIYAKQTSAIYSALSSYSQGLVDELYSLIDGATIWTLLNSNLNNDNNSTQMNNNILTNSSYGQIYNNNGIEYCSLLFSLASQPDFFLAFDNTVAQEGFDWSLISYILECNNSLSSNTFGFNSIQ